MTTQDAVLIELTVNRRYRALSPQASRLFQIFREGIRGVIVLLVAWLLFRRYPAGPAALASLGLAWAVAGAWFRQEGPGRSRVLLTQDAVHYVERGVSCGWDEIARYEVRGKVLEFEPREDRGLFAARRLRIPLGESTGERIKDLFRERVGRRG